ncbi:MAG: hypothetical protein EBT00_15330 [Proteobacteria bacterium]|nr:hypothetical protein [Pseudomonadota bacterium]NDE08112.1 hypothetical protein [Chloroflexota bacterium]
MHNHLMQEVTITLKLRVNDDACLADWVPQSIIEQLEPGEELLAYDDTERVWTAELPPGMTQEQAQADYEQALANLATVH